jgi:hypothetical protein
MCLVSGFVLCLATTAGAQEPAPATPDPAPTPEAQPPEAKPAPPAPLFLQPKPQPQKLSITMSPIHLFLPVLELSAEHRLSRNLGVAAMLGAGKLTDPDTDNTFNVFEVGGSLRYYALGTFKKGMQLGGAAEYVRLKGDDLNDSMISGVGNGLLIALFVGYKHTFGSGLTLEAQLGPQLLVLRAESDDGGESASNATGTYLNLNAGWSF